MYDLFTNNLSLLISLILYICLLFKTTKVKGVKTADIRKNEKKGMGGGLHI